MVSKNTKLNKASKIKIYVGKRGGRYYMKGGNKVYIRNMRGGKLSELNSKESNDIVKDAILLIDLYPSKITISEKMGANSDNLPPRFIISTEKYIQLLDIFNDDDTIQIKMKVRINDYFLIIESKDLTGYIIIDLINDEYLYNGDGLDKYIQQLNDKGIGVINTTGLSHKNVENANSNKPLNLNSNLDNLDFISTTSGSNLSNSGSNYNIHNVENSLISLLLIPGQNGVYTEFGNRLYKNINETWTGFVKPLKIDDDEYLQKLRIVSDKNTATYQNCLVGNLKDRIHRYNSLKTYLESISVSITNLVLLGHSEGGAILLLLLQNTSFCEIFANKLTAILVSPAFTTQGTITGAKQIQAEINISIVLANVKEHNIKLSLINTDDEFNKDREHVRKQIENSLESDTLITLENSNHSISKNTDINIVNEFVDKKIMDILTSDSNTYSNQITSNHKLAQQLQANINKQNNHTVSEPQIAVNKVNQSKCTHNFQFSHATLPHHAARMSYYKCSKCEMQVNENSQVYIDIQRKKQSKCTHNFQFSHSTLPYRAARMSYYKCSKCEMQVTDSSQVYRDIQRKKQSKCTHNFQFSHSTLLHHAAHMSYYKCSKCEMQVSDSSQVYRDIQPKKQMSVANRQSKCTHEWKRTNNV